MDPLSLGIGAVGLGLKIFGGFGAASAQSDAYRLQQQEAQQEMVIEQQKQQAFELQTRRSQMENFRNVQRARAQGLNSSVAQGANKGSGIQGGMAQAEDQGGVNNLGLTQNLGISRNIFAANQAINMDKIQIAGDMSTAATDQGWANLGGSIMGSAGTIGNIFGAAGSGIKSMNLGQRMFGGGSPSGYGSGNQ